MPTTTQKRRSSRPKFSHKEIAEEIRRMRVTDRIYSPSYVGRVRSGYDHSGDLEKFINSAIANLEARAAKAKEAR